MLRIAACDDMPEDLALILRNLQRYIRKNELEVEVETFSHPDTLLLAAEKTPFDLYLLDVVMPMINGIDVGRELRQKYGEPQIIYFTTSDEFAVDAFSLRAVHYLIKPFTDEKFDEAMERAMERLHFSEEKTLTIKMEGGELRNVDVDEIKYIESNGHSVQIHLKHSVCTEMRRSLSRLYEELERIVPAQFIQPYKGYVVNQRAIMTIESRALILTDAVRIPIPRGSFRQLQAQYVTWRFDRKENKK